MTDAQLMRRAQIEHEVDQGKHDQAYWEFVVDRGAGEIPLHEDAIAEAIESGNYFESFVDYLEGV
jgi:pyrimidine operon attenuation protein/uracil phosphoribosyltransferase